MNPTKMVVKIQTRGMLAQSLLQSSGYATVEDDNYKNALGRDFDFDDDEE